MRRWRKRRAADGAVRAGGSLDRALTAGACGGGPWRVARLREVALALAYLHGEAGLAHRDVKPAN